MKILIVEDEQLLADDICHYLSDQYECDRADSVRQAIDRVRSRYYDCILLDLMLPDGNGLEVLRAAKKRSPETGVIIVSAKGALNDKIEGLTIGADDYISKPFHLPELSVRIFALMRRKPSADIDLLQRGKLTINTADKSVCVGTTPLSLTQSEYRLLLLLVQNSQRVLSKDALAKSLLNDIYTSYCDYNFLYSHIKNLKAKLEKAGLRNCIKTVYGLGYKWNDPES